MDYIKLSEDMVFELLKTLLLCSYTLWSHNSWTTVMDFIFAYRKEKKIYIYLHFAFL